MTMNCLNMNTNATKCWLLKLRINTINHNRNQDNLFCELGKTKGTLS